MLSRSAGVHLSLGVVSLLGVACGNASDAPEPRGDEASGQNPGAMPPASETTTDDLGGAPELAGSKVDDTVMPDPEGADEPDEEIVAPAIDLGSVQLVRHGALGFCIEEGQFVAAQVEPGPSGAPMLSGQIHRGWDDPGLTGCQYLECEQLQEFGPVELSGEQQVILKDLMDRLPSGGCLGEVSVVCDPCLVSKLTINGAEYTSNPCVQSCADTPTLTGDVEAAIDSFLDP